MATIIYVDHEGTERAIEATNGESVMETAIKNSIPGIDADCGGACACSTCHVVVDAEWFDKLPEASEEEEDMLDFAAGVRRTSRLSCQIDLTEERDGLSVTVPAEAHDMRRM